MKPIPDLIDNQKHELAQVLKDLLAGGDSPTLDVVTAFFNLKALQALSPAIEEVARLRLLLGKAQDQAFVVGERLLAEMEEAAAKGETTAREIGHWRDFLAQARVEIRRYLKGFCHGKAYILTGVPALGAVGIVGSSNLTGAGLTANLELNAVLKQGSAVQELGAWFESLWREAEDYKAELLELLGRFTRTYTPYEIYIKVIYEALRDKLDQNLEEEEKRPSPIALTDFQHEGYLAAKEILESYGGVLIADSVGLGKTHLALRLLDDYAYRERQMALVVCPAAVQDTVWRPLLERHAIPHELISLEKVSQGGFPIGDYARRFRVVVVDESHNLRNPRANRWRNLFELLRRGEDTKVILLSATPVNNTVFDLYHQLRLITRGNEAQLSAAGIPNLKEYFRQAEENSEALYEVLEALAVRRSRRFIRENYPNAEIDGKKVRFPERELHTVHYSLKETYGEGLYQRIAQAIEGLRLAPYQRETYRRELVEAQRQKGLSLEAVSEGFGEGLRLPEKEAHDLQMAIGRQRALAGIMRMLYLKRLESSVAALQVSLDRLHGFLEKFLKALEEGRFLSPADYRRFLKGETPDDEGPEEEEDFTAFLGGLEELDPEGYDLERIRADVHADLESLRGILAELARGDRDAKLEALKELLASPELAGKKVLLFSYFRDTARYLHKKLREDQVFLARLGHQRISIVDSGIDPGERKDRVVRFAPRANGKPDLPQEEQIDLLISTDVLSEGQNLQDGEVMVNYDLHWNPVRMVQRAGRLDRLGSPHERIHIYNFFPEDELDQLLGLMEKLYDKLRDINRTVGLDASVLGEAPNPMDFNILRRIEEGDKETLRHLEDQSELAVGEFLKEDLLHFLKRLGEERLKRIPLGVGTARKGASPGFFAAFHNSKTGRHHWLFQEEGGKVVEGQLKAIRYIRSGPEEPPVDLPEGFDPRPQIRSLRRHLWERIRGADLKLPSLPEPQKRIVDWLRAQLPSAERNRLLAYFEEFPIDGPALSELRRLWRSRSSRTPSKWMEMLLEFAEKHPHPKGAKGEEGAQTAPEREEDLECVAWVLVVGAGPGGEGGMSAEME